MDTLTQELLTQELLTQELIDSLSRKTHFNNFEIKAKGNRGFFKGFASTYDLDEGGDRIIPGAFFEDLAKFMENPVMLFSHQLDKVIGSWKILEEQEKGLYGEAEINLNTQLGKDVYALITDGDLKGLSIGYEVREADIDKVTGVRLLKKVRLWEVSIVAIPMNQNAWITGTKIFTGVDLKEKEDKEFNFKFRHKDEELKFEDVAVDMYTLLKEKNDCDLEETLKHLADHYEELGKEIPPGFDDKDISWQEDEPYYMETVRFNGAVNSIINLAKHWTEEGRSQSASETLCNAVNELSILMPQANEAKDDKQANAFKEEDIQILTKAISDVTQKLTNTLSFESRLKEDVKKIFNEALSKATGKDIK
jgi:HK97 family phage prohead protease